MEDKLSALPFLLLAISQFILFFMLDFRLDCIERKMEKGERKKGKWIETGANYECPFCHNEYDYIATRMGNRWNFCPMCGARMDGEDDD